MRNTKEMLLQEAFKLFASKPYDQVTFTCLEKATGLSRGAILYHIRHKGILFREVIDIYLFQQNSIKKVFADNPGKGLWDFILLSLNFMEMEKEELKKIGIQNINMAMFNLENAAFFFDSNMKQKANEWIEQEVEIWEQVLNNALAGKEIKDDTDVSLIAVLFKDIYFGCSYTGVVQSGGMDLNRMKREFEFIYKAIKR